LALENAVCEDPISKPGGHPEGEDKTDAPNRRSPSGRRGLVSHAGAFLLVELADRLELTAALSAAMAPSRERRSTTTQVSCCATSRSRSLTAAITSQTAQAHPPAPSARRRAGSCARAGGWRCGCRAAGLGGSAGRGLRAAAGAASRLEPLATNRPPGTSARSSRPPASACPRLGSRGLGPASRAIGHGALRRKALTSNARRWPYVRSFSISLPLGLFRPAPRSLPEQPESRSHLLPCHRPMRALAEPLRGADPRTPTTPCS